jgi:hypothetical protein
LRLPPAEREAFIHKYETKLFEAHGTVLKEYVLVPESLAEQTEVLKGYFAAGFDFVKGLKPKAGKKS